MTIAVENLQKRIRLKPRRLLRAVEKILRHERIAEAELSLTFVGDRKMRSLHKQYLKTDHPTDVLTFDFSSGKFSAKSVKICAEIVISTDTASRNARLYGNSVDEEILLYVIHGILHLLGFDDHRREDVKKMRSKETELMRVAAQKL